MTDKPMDADSFQYWGVITGDIIGFSGLDLSLRRRMPGVVVEGGRRLCETFEAIMPWDVDVFRGDGWQALISRPALALRAALFFRANIIAAAEGQPVDTRMAIGIGPVDYVPERNVAAGDGYAYRVSGKTLEGMASPRKGNLRCAFVREGVPENRIPADMPDEELIDAVVRLSGAIGDRWRARRARVVAGALRGFTQKRIAAMWPGGPVSRQAVGKHLERAGWHGVNHALRVFETRMACFEKSVRDTSKAGICP